jgi:hypothetical protein
MNRAAEKEIVANVYDIIGEWISFLGVCFHLRLNVHMIDQWKGLLSVIKDEKYTNWLFYGNEYYR